MNFFPPNTLHTDPETHAGHELWFAGHLISLDEAPLHPPATDRPDIYRLLFLATYGSPVLVSVSEAGEKRRVVCKSSDGLAGFPVPGRLVSEADRELSSREAARFAELLELAAFWEMQSCVDDSGFDGSHAVLEGLRAGRYHVVDRWSPRNTPYAELVQFMLGLCGD